MRRGGVALLVAVCALVPAGFTSGDDAPFVVSSWVELTPGSKERALAETGRAIDHLDLFNFAIDAKGGFAESVLDSLDPYVAKVRARGGRAAITFIDWTGSAREAVRTASVGRRFARNVARACVEHDLHGVDLDFERLERGDRESFTRFASDVARELRARGKKLSVTVIARTRDDAIPGAAFAQDLAALAPIADTIKLMTYDYSGPWSAPGPIGPIDWSKQVVAHAVSKGVPRSKLVLGIPLYGRSWPGGRNVGADAARELARLLGATPRFDEGRGETTFRASGRTVWFTDARAIAAKVSFARSEGLGGVALFSAGWARDPELRAVERARRAGIAGAITPR